MNYYEDHTNRMMADLFEELAYSKVVEIVHSIYYSSNGALKEQYKDMLFLADPKFQDPDEWVRKAVCEFRTNDVFEQARNSAVKNDLFVQCRLVKAYRTIVKEKRKQKQEPSATLEEIFARIRMVQGA